MATNNPGRTDVDTHRRKIFVQEIGPTTTQRSLRDYFSKYPIEWCAVPLDKEGKNRMHGMITFRDEQSVDAVMSQRSHEIDGKIVFIHRALPNEQSAKSMTGIQQLIVSGLKNQSLAESDVRNYFASYGEICDIHKMRDDDNIWLIDFDYYDSVDKVIQNAPHCIGRIDVNVKKGDRNAPRRRSPAPRRTPTINNNNNAPEVIPHKSNLKKVKINEHITCLNLPPKKSHIHITNLPANIDAETLSDEFDWNIYHILMNPSVGECWLKNAKDERAVDEFIQRWNGKTIERSIIQCEKEEDQLELCNKFRFGQCQKTSANCNWEHVPCTAKGSCASTCSYGHEVGMKSGHDAASVPPGTGAEYRIKVTGSKTRVTQTQLQLRFRLINYNIDPENELVTYVSKIKTMKYAKQLMTEWHEKVIDGQRIKCQLELNPRPARARSPAASDGGKRNRSRSRSQPRDARSLRSAQEVSDFDDTDDYKSISFDNREADRDRRISGKALRDVTQTLSKTSLSHASSSETSTEASETKYRLPSGVSTDEWEITNKASNSDEKLLLIRSKVDRKGLAAIKIYPIRSSDDFNREISAMKELRDIKGVNQLIEQGGNRDQLWLIMERARGYSLKEFIERKHQGVLNILTAIELALNLTGTIQQIHSKGIFHQNLSPENIMIEWDSRPPTDRAQLTVLNFSQAVNVSTKTNTLTPSSKEKWYRAPQTDDQGLRSTIDSSGCCAILFWVLTRIDPRHSNSNLPHQQARDKLNDMIKSEDRKMLVEEQLRRYLIDTFDRAFGYPHHHPWTIGDLKCRLESIHRLLMPSEPKLNSIDGIFQELVSISDSVPTPSIAVNDAQLDAFEKASKAFCQAKKHFLEDKQEQYQWSDGHCIWVHSPHSSINECRNDDILTYSSFRGRTTTSYSIIITCLARSSEEGRLMTLFISSYVNGKTIEVPIGQYPTAQDYTIMVQENFKKELINLLAAIYNEKKAIQN